MKANFISLTVMLLAGSIAGILCIMQNREVTETLITLLIVLSIFYILGRILQKIILKALVIIFEETEIEDEAGLNHFDVDENGVLIVTEGVTKNNNSNDENEDDW